MKYNETEIQEMFDEMLNDVYGTFRVGVSEFDASEILRELDPIAYRTGLSDFESELENED